MVAEQVSSVLTSTVVVGVVVFSASWQAVSCLLKRSGPVGQSMMSCRQV